MLRQVVMRGFINNYLGALGVSGNPLREERRSRYFRCRDAT
jgi:hypothetical protein